MVYSIRTNASLVSRKPLKMIRSRDNMSERINKFLNGRKISVQTLPDGEVKVKLIK